MSIWITTRAGNLLKADSVTAVIARCADAVRDEWEVAVSAAGSPLQVLCSGLSRNDAQGIRKAVVDKCSPGEVQIFSFQNLETAPAAR